MFFIQIAWIRAYNCGKEQKYVPTCAVEPYVLGLTSLKRDIVSHEKGEPKRKLCKKKFYA